MGGLERVPRAQLRVQARLRRALLRRAGMLPPMALLDLSLRSFLATLAAKTPTPGGGSVAALNAALGLGLVAMAAQFTSGAKYATVETDAANTIGGCDLLRARATALVDADSAAYDLVTAAYGLPKGTDAEKAARAEAIQRALEGAMDVPQKTIDVAIAGLELAAAFAPKSNKNLASDVFVGATCLLAAVEGARANVKINAAGLTDAAKAQSALAAADAALAKANRLLSQIRTAIG